MKRTGNVAQPGGISTGRRKVEPRDSPSKSDLALESTQSSTDPDDHMEQDLGARNPPPVSGWAIPHTCLICEEMLHSGLALEWHMKSQHPLKHPYQCAQCDTKFNNLWELSSHTANQHWRHKVSCKHCEYRTVSASRMKVHVHLHMKGMKCSKYDHAFPSVASLNAHEKQHRKQRELFDCDHCDSSYSTATPLRIHTQGKHGLGFICDSCCKRFDSPIQLKRHHRMCNEQSD